VAQPFLPRTGSINSLPPRADGLVPSDGNSVQLRRHSAGSKPRGIGILADEDTNPIGWKPMPLLPAHQEKSKTCKQRAVGMMPIPRNFWTIGKVDRAVPARYLSL
jgi:hypothetical protein